MDGSTPPAQIACQGLIQRSGGRDLLVVDGVVVALLAQVANKFLHNLLVSAANRPRIGDHVDVRGFEILEQNIAVERKIKLGRVEQVKDDDVVALEAKLAQAFEHQLGVIEQVGHQDDQTAALDLAGKLVENFTDVGFARGAATFQRMEDLQEIVALGARRHEGFDAIGESDDAGGILLFENEIGKRSGQCATVVELGYAVGGVVHRGAGVEQEISAQIGFVFVLFDEVTV